MADTLASEQFSVRWDQFSSNLTSGFLSHLSNNDLVDVTLAVEGKLFQAHKLVLSVCSPYFKDIFKVNPCQHPVVILKDMGHAEVGSLLRFMYQGEVNVRQDDLAAFLKVAEILQIKGLTGDGTRCDPHNHDSSSGNRSDVLLSLENMEADGCSNEVKTLYSSEANLPLHRTKVVDKAKAKKLLKATVSNTPANKHRRTLPPPLKKMDIPTSTLEKVILKSEPVDCVLQDDQFTLIEGPLNNSSLPKLVLRPDAAKYLKDGQNSNADRQQQPSSSSMDFSCLQADIMQKKIGRSNHPRLHLGGHIYLLTHKNREKIYWRCGMYRTTKCIARTITAAGVVLRKTGTHNHGPETRDAFAYYSNPGKFIRRTARNSKMTAVNSCKV